MKKIIVLTLAIFLSLSLTSCVQKDEKTRLIEVLTDITCEIYKPLTEVKTGGKNFEESINTNGGLDYNQKEEEIIRKHGFESSEKLDEISEKYQYDKNFREEVRQSVLDKCDFDINDNIIK